MLDGSISEEANVCSIDKHPTKITPHKAARTVTLGTLRFPAYLYSCLANPFQIMLLQVIFYMAGSSPSRSICSDTSESAQHNR